MERTVKSRGSSKLYLVAYDRESAKMGFLEIGTLNFTDDSRQIMFTMYITAVEKWDYKRKIERIEECHECLDESRILALLKEHDCTYSELAQNELIKWNNEDRFGDHLYRAVYTLMDSEGVDYQADICSIGKVDLSYDFPRGVIPEFAPLLAIIRERYKDLGEEEIDSVMSQLDSIGVDADGIFKEICEEYYGAEGLY